MNLFIFRHAIAEDRDVFARTGKEDELRPLIPRGRRRMQKICRGLSRLNLSPEYIVSSELVRAKETAEIIQSVLGGKIQINSSMNPGGDSQRLFKSLAELSASTIAVVGHEPDLSYLVSELTSSSDQEILRFKKGGVCALEFLPGSITRAKISWFLGPRQILDLCEL